MANEERPLGRLESLERHRMSALPVSQAGAVESSCSPTSVKSGRGRWKIGAGLLGVASLAQAALWTMWWEDPTHFKMSILFVWPAALFSLLIWWTFFSGWSATVRFRSAGVGLRQVSCRPKKR